MSGHGHVTPNANGSRARCGGPGICPACSVEFAQQEKLAQLKEAVIAAAAVSIEWKQGLVELGDAVRDLENFESTNRPNGQKE